jgi:MtaA/CmuA family methyltransferase
MNGRERIFAVLDHQVTDRPGVMPITMMFAARHAGLKYGRYALDHRIMVESQIRTSADFGFDHVSAITETREAPDCGAAIQMFDDQPYAMDESNSRLSQKGDLAGLAMPDPFTAAYMSDRLAGLRVMKQMAGAEKIVEGWVEGPCGASADLRGINRLMLDFNDDPEFVRDLFEFVVELGARFGRAQVEAGADVLGMGDPAASLVGPRIYEEVVWPYQKMLVDALHDAGARVRLHICGNTRRILGPIAHLGCDIVDIDSKVPLAEAREKLGPEQVLLGSIDPVRSVQNASPAEVAAAVEECLRIAGPNFIIGAGCEIPPDTPSENLRALCGVR